MKFDLQDALLGAGFVSIVGGVAMLSRPAALILAGLLCFVFVAQIERAKLIELRRKTRVKGVN